MSAYGTVEEDSSRRAFDPHRPPEADLIDDCVHCGFCLPTCPTYVLWGEEMDSPRGRIVLMGAGLEEGSRMSESMVTHFDRCLGCMACVTSCPSGVRYDKLIEAVRPQVERNHERSRSDRLLRRTLFGIFTHPGRVRALVPLLAALRLLRSARGRPRVPSSGRAASVKTLMTLTPRVPLRRTWERMPEWTRARGPKRGTVGLLQGCVQRVFFYDVNAASARVLAAEGFEIFAPAAVRCCGALMLHSGFEPEALELAKEMIEAFEGCDLVAVNAAGCGSSMKDYGHLLADDPEWAERARNFSNKVRDISELLAAQESVASRHPLPLKVAYHDACHLAHAQGIRSEPRGLLSAIPGLELVEPVEWELCCGSAGLYNVLQADAGAELGARKAQNLLATGADVIAAGNPGCALQIAAHLGAERDLPVLHPIQLLDASIRGRHVMGTG